MNFMLHTMLDVASDVLIVHYKNSGGGREAKGTFAPGCTEEGASFGGAKIWNSEIWPLLAN